MNNNRCHCSKCRKTKCFLRFPICIDRCHCSKCCKKKCVLRFPVCIECSSGHSGPPGSLELLDQQNDLEEI